MALSCLIFILSVLLSWVARLLFDLELLLARCVRVLGLLVVVILDAREVDGRVLVAGLVGVQAALSRQRKLREAVVLHQAVLDEFMVLHDVAHDALGAEREGVLQALVVAKVIQEADELVLLIEEAVLALQVRFLVLIALSFTQIDQAPLVLVSWHL